MDNAIYATLNRQSGLMREMRVVANNMANANTTGFRREGVIFSEYLVSLDRSGNTLSMANARGRLIDARQGGLTQTNGTYDLALEGEGYFMVETPQGNMLTRAGAFIASADGSLMTADGARLLDDGQAPVIVPDGVRSVAIGPDGTLSADGTPVAQIGVFASPDPASMAYQGGTRFSTTADVEPAEDVRIHQGFLEESNVDPVAEISRMIEVQRAYELGQSFMEREDERIRNAITAMTR
ncbi:MAG: flagellar hook-basal body complex protein [Paracoccus sp. (in: a-proteobacteria)]|nr:flagellar hook-basal body complex protein [Paracoccus sp. (in: a-proteobacteria)]